MGHVIDFETGAVAQLQRKIAISEAERQDLLAFGRGHWTATRSIHDAVLAIIQSEGFDHLLHIVTVDWPDMLGVDAVAIALLTGDTAVRVDLAGSQSLEPRLIEAVIGDLDRVALRCVDKGHPLFGAAADMLRAEAIVPLRNADPLPSGLLLLGQRQGEAENTPQGEELLDFLGASLARMIGRWLLP